MDPSLPVKVPLNVRVHGELPEPFGLTGVLFGSSLIPSFCPSGSVGVSVMFGAIRLSLSTVISIFKPSIPILSITLFKNSLATGAISIFSGTLNRGLSFMFLIRSL